MNIIINSKTAKWVSVVAGVAVAAVFLAPTGVVRADHNTDHTIQQLLVQIASLQAQIAALQGSVAGTCSFNFTLNLSMGASNAEVMNVQKFLNMDAATKVAVTGAGSPGNETNYFGSLTKAAVVKFQNKYAAEILTPLGLTAGTGYWGPASRAKANALCTGGVTPPPPPPPPGVTGTVSVTAGVQPTNSLAPYNAARVPFTNFTVTAGATDVTLDSVLVERTGLATDANFTGVVLLDSSGTQVGLSKTLNSVHQATIGEAVVIPAGQSRTFTVAGNMAAAATVKAGEVASFTVVALNTPNATVSGTLPITGASHTINATLAIGTITNARGPLDPNSAATKEVGTTGYTFSSIKVTAGSQEKIRLNSIRWNQSGSAGSADLANIKVKVDAAEYTPVISSDGKYYTATFGGILIDKGASVEISVKGDIVGGSARTIAFDLYRTTDLNVTGDTYGYGITPPTSGTGFASTNPWYDASVVTVSNGSIVVSKAVSVAAQNIAINLANQPLGGFDVEVKGEAISVASIKFNVSTSTASITNISLYGPTGLVVAGPVDLTAVAAETSNLTFSDTVTFPIGKGTYTLKGKLGTTWGNNGTASASTTPSSDWTTVTGQVTGNTITPSPTSVVTGNTMTSKSASLTASVSASPVAQTVVSGGSQFTFANYQLDASASGEDIRFNTLLLAYDANGNTATNIKNCRLYDGALDLSGSTNKVDPSATASSTSFTIDGGLTITKGTVKTVAMKCDIAGGATGSYRWGLDSLASMTATGLTSGQSATLTLNDSVGQLMTLATGGSLTVTLDTANTPSYGLAAAGTTGNTFSVLKVHATNEAITLNKIGLQLTNTASSSAKGLTSVTLWDGSTLVGSQVFAGTDTTMTLTLSTPVLIAKDADKLLTVKGDLAQIGTSQDGTAGHLVAIDYDGTTAANTQGTGQSSGTTINTSSTGDTASSGLRTQRTYPVIARVAPPTNTLDNGQKSLLRFKITANGNTGDNMAVSKFTIRVATTTATVTSINIYAYTDLSFSTPVSGLSSAGQMLATDLAGTAWVTSSTDLEIYAQTSGAASTTIQIPVGSTRYFDVVGTVSGATSGASISTQLQGDAAYPRLAASTFMDKAATVDNDPQGIGTGTNDDFLWSPNSTTTSEVGHQDWTNGYGVSGLPGTNMTAEVLSK